MAPGRAVAPRQTQASKQGEGMKYMTDEDVRERFLEFMAEMGGSVYSADDGVEYHDGTKIILPKGMSPAKGSEVLKDVATALAQKEVFTHVFKYRPMDGAFALVQVMKKFFGTTGRGKPIQTMFGPVPPQQLEIEIDSEGHTAQVPWGHVEFSQVEGVLMLGSVEDPEYGSLFQLSVHCPKRYGQSVAGFFQMIERQLKSESIYKGAAIKGTDEPRFIPINPDATIVYSDDVNQALDTTVWGVIRNSKLLKEDGKKINKRVLLHGPYGTGKSEAGLMTASVANAHGWTFIQFKSGDPREGSLEALEKTVQLAKLYAPAVVFVEDVDIYAGQEGQNSQTRITNLFDGIGSKSDEVMIVMTSNREANFSKGMLRAGRIDRMIEIGALDRPATEQLIRRVIGEARLGKVNFDDVWDALKNYEPAFVRLTFDQAAEAAVIRTGSRDYVLDTEDFVTAARLLRPQHDLHARTSDAKKTTSLDSQILSLVKKAVVDEIKMTVEMNDGDYEGSITATPVEH